MPFSSSMFEVQKVSNTTNNKKKNKYKGKLKEEEKNVENRYIMNK